MPAMTAIEIKTRFKKQAMMIKNNLGFVIFLLNKKKPVFVNFLQKQYQLFMCISRLSDKNTAALLRRVPVLFAKRKLYAWSIIHC